MKKTEEISGWFNYEDVYDFLLSKVPDNGVFVECGAWLGKSSSYLCDKAKERITIFIVDSWKGSDNELKTTHKLATQVDIYNLFCENMGNRKFKALRKISTEAAKDFEDQSCEVVFIDMNHSYDSVKQDIITWLPKVKAGGYLAGHDYYNIKNDSDPVASAVHEVLGKENVNSIGINSWLYKKETNYVQTHNN
jgi:hypothetical protein